MVCEKNETDVNIGIPVVMLPQDAGGSLKESMRNSSHGKLWAPRFWSLEEHLTYLLPTAISNFLCRQDAPSNACIHKLCSCMLSVRISLSIGNEFTSLVLFSVSIQIYSPKRPLVDVAEVFLWLMAVGTVLCSSYWSAWSAREAAIEQDKLLKVMEGDVQYNLLILILEER